MDSANYVTLTRQSGLMREMQGVANNIANLSTTGFRREGVIFAEHVVGLSEGPSLSVATASGSGVSLNTSRPDSQPGAEPAATAASVTCRRCAANWRNCSSSWSRPNRASACSTWI